MKRNQWKQENIRLGTHGEDYGSWMSNPVFYIIGGIMEQVHRVVLSHLDYDGQEKILEVGCGSGALIIRAALTWSKAKVIGIDYWGAVYTYSKALCEKNAVSEGVASRCVFQHGDAKQLDFPDESFDVVISNYVYHNVMGADMQKLRDMGYQDVRLIDTAQEAFGSTPLSSYDDAGIFQTPGRPEIISP